MFEAIGNELSEMLADQPVDAAVYMIHTLNRSFQNISESIDTLSRYIANIIEHPTEEKYRRIKMSNRIFTVIFNCLFVSHFYCLFFHFRKEYFQSKEGSIF